MNQDAFNKGLTAVFSLRKTALDWNQIGAGAKSWATNTPLQQNGQNATNWLTRPFASRGMRQNTNGFADLDAKGSVQLHPMNFLSNMYNKHPLGTTLGLSAAALGGGYLFHKMFSGTQPQQPAVVNNYYTQPNQPRTYEKYQG